MSAHDGPAFSGRWGRNVPGRLPTVCVQGLGFVGAAVCIAVASARDAEGRPLYRVIGVDLPSDQGSQRIAALNSGKFPFKNPDLDLTVKLQEAHAIGNLQVCSDPAVFGEANIIIIDVPFDVVGAPGWEKPDFETFTAAVRTVGGWMMPDAMVVVETTVPPGTTQRVVAPILSAALRARGLPCDKFKLAHCYERVMPGPGYLDSIVRMPRIYAGIDACSASACAAFLSTIVEPCSHPLTQVLSTTASELAKVLENSYRAITIALMDEFAAFAEAAGVNLDEIIDPIRRRPSHSNLRSPGFGVGGYCLTKDPLLVDIAAKELFGLKQEFPFCRLAVSTNRESPLRILKRVRDLLGGALEGRCLLLLGISYRPDIDDTRRSASETFYEAARALGAQVLVHDPIVRYWREVGLDIYRQIPDPLGLDAVILAVPHEAYCQFDYVRWLGDSRPLIFDAFQVLRPEQRAALRSAGCRVEGVGRGSTSSSADSRSAPTWPERSP